MHKTLSTNLASFSKQNLTHKEKSSNLLTSSLKISLYKKLKKLGAVTIYHQTDKDEIKSRIQNANVVITNKHYLGEEELKDALQLKLVCVTATGVNNIDLEYCKKAGITVCKSMS